jgi:hypothetical protein
MVSRSWVVFLVIRLVKELENDPKDKTQSKDDAKAKTQPNDKTESRKRTSSTVAVADKPKKVKETERASEFPFPSLQQTSFDIGFRRER